MKMRMSQTALAFVILLSACSGTAPKSQEKNEAPALAQATRAVAPEPADTQVAMPSQSPTMVAAVAKTAVSDLPAEDVPGNSATDAMPFPDEVTDFMVSRDGCEHFIGEEPYDEERRAFLNDNIRALCTGTDTKLADLRQRYRNDVEVMAALKGYEEGIEGTSSPKE